MAAASTIAFTNPSTRETIVPEARKTLARPMRSSSATGRFRRVAAAVVGRGRSSAVGSRSVSAAGSAVASDRRQLRLRLRCGCGADTASTRRAPGSSVAPSGASLSDAASASVSEAASADPSASAARSRRRRRMLRQTPMPNTRTTIVAMTAEPRPSQSACTFAGITTGSPIGTPEVRRERDRRATTSPLPTPAATGTRTVERDWGSTVASTRSSTMSRPLDGVDVDHHGHRVRQRVVDRWRARRSRWTRR